MRLVGRPELKRFFGRALSLASSILTLAMLLLVAFTVLSRLGYLNLAGVSVVVSRSMEPSIRLFDLVVYANASYTTGDVIVYCDTPSHCYVHRVIGFLNLDTVNGNVTKVVTKGDNVNEADSPVDPAWVRGKAVFVVPRELWMPLIALLLAGSVYGLVKLPVVGLSYVLVFAVGFTSIVAVYALVPQPIAPTPPRVHTLHLSGVYLDPVACSVTIRYTGELSLSSVTVKAGSLTVEVVSVGEREVTFKPSPDVLEEAFRLGELHIEVHAQLNGIGRLHGRYSLRVGGLNPEVSSFSGAALIRNPNCFPLRLHVSIRYYDTEWRWLNTTHVVDGFSYLTLEPPPGSRFAYAYIYWFNQGELRWVGLPLKT